MPMPTYGTYQYQAQDSPLSLANQWGVTPQQVINANQGGYPFSTGQVINIPRPVYSTTPGQNFSFQYGSQGSGSNAWRMNTARINTLPAWQASTPRPALPANANPYQAAINAGNITGAGSAPPFYGQSQSPTTVGTTAIYSQTQSPTNTGTAALPNPTIGPTSSGSGFGGFGGPRVGDIKSGMAEQDLLKNILARVKQDPTALDRLPPATRDAVNGLLEARIQSQGSVTNRAGTGSAEFMNTEFMQDNAAKGVEFENQLRWDENRGEYRKIGDMIRSGDLDVRGSGRGWRRRGGGGGGGGRNQPASQQPRRWARGFGVVNFNISTG